MPNSAFSAFFGIFDSDGRPWEHRSSSLAAYTEGVVSALKVAALTQRHLVLPAGYLLDNPALQRTILNFSGQSDEGKAFFEVVQDLVRIAQNESLAQSTSDTVDWQDTYDSWVRGSLSNRGQLVHLNCIPQDDAERLQTYTDVSEFKRAMHAALLQLRGVDYSTYLSTLELVRFRPVSQPPFRFDEILRTHLLTGAERFVGFEEPLLDKLLAAADAASNAGVRISRSLLNNPTLSQEIGVPEREVLSRGEYKRIARTLAHYHHMAFAEAFSLGAIATFQIPTPSQESAALLSECLRELATPLNRESGGVSISWPLRAISFTDIYALRLGKHRQRFFAGLDAIYDAALIGDAGHFRSAFRAHTRTVAAAISMTFGNTAPIKVATELASAAYSAATKPDEAHQEAVKLLPHFKDLLPNLQKELQVRFFFRSIKPRVLANAA